MRDENDDPRAPTRPEALSLPAYKYHDRRDHRCEEHEAAEHSQSDHGAEIQLGLVSAARQLGTVHSERAGRFRHGRSDSRLSMIDSTPGYFVVLRMIAAGVVEHR